jgi:dTDP-4-amino-4,6-dideoxygalactose transaminase
LKGANLNVPFLDLDAMHDEIRSSLDQAWKEVTATSTFIGGPHVERFEEEWAAECDRAHAVGVANGTDALSIVLAALGVARGDEVIVPANTFIATAEAVSAVGATPVFADVDPDTLLVTPDTVRPHLSPRTAALIVVHLYGQVAEMEPLLDLTRAAGIALVEDAAQAHGARWRGRPAGSFGIAGAFSFYPGKNLGAFGDAGAIVTDDRQLADRARSISNHGRGLSGPAAHGIIGRNSRLDGLQAAVLSVKLRRLGIWVAARRAAAQRYDVALGDGSVRPVSVHPDAESSYHLYVVRVEDRPGFRADLAAAGITTRVHYERPCHLEPAYGDAAADPLPVAERAGSEVVSLPMYPHLSRQQIDAVCAAAGRWSETRVRGAAL